MLKWERKSLESWYSSPMPMPTAGAMAFTGRLVVRRRVRARSRRRLAHVHLSENDRGTPGTGQVHWEATFAALKKINYDRWLVIEAFGRAPPDLAAATRVWRDLFDDPLVLCQSGLKFVRSGIGS
jgi:sugar phosphate isomerase/epimerase